MAVKTEPLGDAANIRVITVTCDAKRAEVCSLPHPWETTFKSTADDACTALASAGGRGWQRLQREGEWIDVCPACVATPGSA